MTSFVCRVRAKVAACCVRRALRRKVTRALMEEITPVGVGLHSYRLKWWAQLWYLGWGVLAGGMGVLFVAAAIFGGVTDGDWRDFLNWRGLLGLVLCVAFLALGYFFFALALRSRVVLEGPRISVRGPLRERSADIHEITGYRVEVTRNATFWKFELRDGECLFVMRSFDVDSAFHDFLSHLRDLNGVVVPTTLFSN